MISNGMEPINISMVTSRSILDMLLPPARQVHYHGVFKSSSLFTGIIPDDIELKTKQYRLYKYFVVIFLFCVCLRIFVECILPKHSEIFIYLGDFKIWWGEPYLANQVVFGFAVVVVPFYQFTNLVTLCHRDNRWVLPFQYCEGIKTAREIKLQDEEQVLRLLTKMKNNFRLAHTMMTSILFSYTAGVFVTYCLFYKSYVQLLVFGLFWTVFEATWSKMITQNMGLYTSTFEVVIYYLHLRYDKVRAKLLAIDRELRLETNERLNKGMFRMTYWSIRIRKAMIEVDDINADMQHYNHYWRKFTIALFASYHPQALFQLYVCLFMPVGTAVMVFGVILTLNITFMLSLLSIFAARVIGKMHSIKKTVNSIYNRLFVASMLSNREEASLKRQRPRLEKQNSINNTINNSHKMTLLRMKLSHFLEQYNFNRVGFYLYDYYIMDWDFYYNAVVNSAVYFFLIVDILR